MSAKLKHQILTQLGKVFDKIDELEKITTQTVEQQKHSSERFEDHTIQEMRQIEESNTIQKQNIRTLTDLNTSIMKLNTTTKNIITESKRNKKAIKKTNKKVQEIHEKHELLVKEKNEYVNKGKGAWIVIIAIIAGVLWLITNQANLKQTIESNTMYGKNTDHKVEQLEKKYNK